MTKKITKGFTMIELLVVIAIIGILASLALVSFSGSQKQARDAKRKSDIKQYQNSLEQYANQNNGLYPSRTDATGANASGALCSTDLGLTSCAEDPRNADDATYVYKYQSDGSGTGTVDATLYVLWAKLENPSTTTYFVTCSTGATGEVTSGIPPAGGVCPI
jgi:prepilin-type N-terminal cleavage/methylation domain-containing protein